MKISFSPPYITEEMIQEVAEVLRSGWITTGPKTAAFEAGLKEFTGAKEVQALNSATAGLELALRWFGIGPGDEVIVPAYTYCASANVVLHCGATVVMADVGSDFNIDVSKLGELITPNTKAIIPVDFGGFPCDYPGISALVVEHKAKFEAKGEQQEKLGRILVLADAAHSLGAYTEKGKVGSLADFSAFSFHAVKNLTTAEGGGLAIHLPIAFDCEAVKKELRKWALHGQSKDALAKTKVGGWRYDVDFPGFKCNMTDIQAAIGLIQLREYPQILARRKEIFDRYANAFEHEIIPPYCTEKVSSSFHVFALRLRGFSESKRDRLMEYCAEQDVAVNVHFQPLPLLTAYRNLGFLISDVPEAFAMYANEISLPVYYTMTEAEMDRVIEVVSAGVKALRDEKTA
ncbi:MAG: dTDP-4-amino-4,6-dideoxygalactose transaminase [Luteibaculaceae bacterium]|jgi:dTDP-4-amino-4,6-dideoxygalactose transaminase